jgi:uncharacterized cupin superfamily protein
MVGERPNPMPKIAMNTVPVNEGSRYPAPFDLPCQTRRSRRLGAVAGLDQFGVNLIELPPGAWSSQRHWHSHEDEFVWIVEGPVTLVTDAGEETLETGDSAGFKAGERDGHCFQNRGAATVRLLVIGSRNDADHGEYPDIDLMVTPGRYSGPARYLHKDGTPY